MALAAAVLCTFAGAHVYPIKLANRKRVVKAACGTVFIPPPPPAQLNVNSLSLPPTCTLSSTLCTLLCARGELSPDVVAAAATPQNTHVHTRVSAAAKIARARALARAHSGWSNPGIGADVPPPPLPEWIDAPDKHTRRNFGRENFGVLSGACAVKMAGASSVCDCQCVDLIIIGMVGGGGGHGNRPVRARACAYSQRYDMESRKLYTHVATNV